MRVFQLLAILGLTIISSCERHNPSPEYGKSFNEERLKRGIRPIPEDAIRNNKSDAKFPMWVNPENTKKHPTSPCWFSKQVEIRDGIPVQETDEFVSCKKYMFAGDKLLDEEFFIRYSYERERQGKDPWWCYVTCGPNSGEHTFAEAKQILRGWGIDYVK